MPKVMKPDFAYARMFYAAIPSPPKISFIPSKTFRTKEDPGGQFFGIVHRLNLTNFFQPL